MNIALISPKGPLYRYRTGILRKSLRAAPLTLTTLAALVPETLNAKVQIYDEGIEDLPSRLDADLVGMTVITGTATRFYELANRFRIQGIPVVIGKAEQTFPRLIEDFRAGHMQQTYRSEGRADLSTITPDHTNAGNFFMLHSYWFINVLLRKEAVPREQYPLGDLNFKGPF